MSSCERECGDWFVLASVSRWGLLLRIGCHRRAVFAALPSPLPRPLCRSSYYQLAYQPRAMCHVLGQSCGKGGGGGGSAAAATYTQQMRIGCVSHILNHKLKSGQSFEIISPSQKLGQKHWFLHLVINILFDYWSEENCNFGVLHGN